MFIILLQIKDRQIYSCASIMKLVCVKCFQDFEMWEVDEDGMFNIIMNVFTQNRREVVCVE